MSLRRLPLSVRLAWAHAEQPGKPRKTENGPGSRGRLRPTSVRPLRGDGTRRALPDAARERNQDISASTQRRCGDGDGRLGIDGEVQLVWGPAIVLRDLLPFLLPNVAEQAVTGRHQPARRPPGMRTPGTYEHGTTRGSTGITCLLIRRAGFETLAADSVLAAQRPYFRWLTDASTVLLELCMFTLPHAELT